MGFVVVLDSRNDFIKNEDDDKHETDSPRLGSQCLQRRIGNSEV